MEVRLHKYLADCGLCSRRKAEALIAAGSIRVNGAVVTQPGTKIKPDSDRVEYGHQSVTPQATHVYIMLHKPVGVLTSCVHGVDTPTVADLVKFPHRLYHVGRLDKDSCGLLLLTNDGDAAHRLSHPRFEHEKEYQVELVKGMSAHLMRQLGHGLTLGGIRTLPARIRRYSAKHFTIVMHEGRNRQIRRMCEALGHPVARLMRVRIGPLEIGPLKYGKWRHLTSSEQAALLKHIHTDAAQPARPHPKSSTKELPC